MIMTKYFGSWSNHESMKSSMAQGRYDYEKGEYQTLDLDHFPTDEEVLFATYDSYDYEGQCYVLYQKDGQLLEFSAGHCSCNGLEDSWGTGDRAGGSPVTWEALALRVPEMKDSWGFLRKADQVAKDTFVELVANHASGQALLDAMNKDTP
jgi:hypothetical protein